MRGTTGASPLGMDLRVQYLLRALAIAVIVAETVFPRSPPPKSPSAAPATETVAREVAAR